MSHITDANGKTTLQFNGRLISAALTQRNISAREAARRTDLTFNIINRLTRGNSYSADLPLRHQLELCDLCDLQLHDLIDLTPTPTMADPGPVPDAEDQGPVDPERLERLAQYLLLHPAGAEPEFIAVAFGWTIGEVHAARAVLNAAIEHVGVTIVHANDRCYLTTTSRDRSTQPATQPRLPHWPPKNYPSPPTKPGCSPMPSTTPGPTSSATGKGLRWPT